MESGLVGKAPTFWAEDYLLYMKGLRLYVSLYKSLRQGLLKDAMIPNGLCIWETLVFIEHGYYRPNMRDDVEAYVKTCPICQQDKVENQASPYYCSLSS